MAKQTINLGTGELTGDGESIRSAFDKVNDNFDEVYARDLNTDVQTLSIDGNTISITGGNSVTIVPSVSLDGDLTGSVFADDSTLLVDGVNGTIPWAVVNGTPTTLAGYGITDSATFAQGALADSALQSVAFTDLTVTPTTLTGYGITDAATTAQGALADSAIQNGGSFDGDVTGSVFGDDSTVLVDGVNNTLHGVVLGGMQEIVGPGVVNLTTTSTEIVTTGTDAYTLANGTYGQIKHIIKIGGASAATITPASFANGTSVELASDFNCVSLLYTNSGWAVIAAQNITINA